MSNSQRKPHLPVGQLVIICISRIGMPLMLNSFPVYLPALLSNLNIPADTVPYWVGVCSAIWSISTCVTAPFWGRGSDSWGRKPAIILANFIYTSCTLVFGFAQALWLIMIVMGLLGVAGGVTPVLHTTVAELVPDRKLQPTAFSLIPFMWTIASMIGPIIGGFLANPAQKYPNMFGKNKFFLHFPYSLPNIVVAMPFAIGCMAGVLFLKETLEGKNHKDPGFRLGQALWRLISFSTGDKSSEEKMDEAQYQMLAQNEPANHELSSERDSSDEKPKISLSSSSSSRSSCWSPGSLFPKTIFTRQSCLTILYICFLQTHSKLFDEFLPIYMQATPSTTTQSQASGPASLLIFGGGLNMSSHTTAIYLTAYGISAMIIQIFIFPPAARWLGPLKALRIASGIYPLVYVLTPYISKLESFVVLRGICLVFLLLSKAFCGIFAFPCSNIMLCNSARNKNTLGSLNGISASSHQLVRAVVAILVGMLFSVGLERELIILPWWGLAAVSFGGLGVVFWLEDEGNE